MKPTIQQLRSFAISHSLFRPTTLRAAFDRLGFVQADPIRAPARAHDLILRQRVKGYLAGDLERRYASLELEEDCLYAYGFLTRELWQLVHRRSTADLPDFEKKVLKEVRRHGAMHPKQLAQLFGSERRTNNWGGYSRVTKLALEDLHERGLLRIAAREKGVRIYAAASLPGKQISERDRLRKLLLAIVNILAPVSERTLRDAVRSMRELIANFSEVLAGLVGSGELQKQVIDGVNYILPAKKMTQYKGDPRVSFLAPFDPLVWDRRRFEHFWGWPYRFEAYTPKAKRLRGYYAMPLLWGEAVVGWANVGIVKGDLNVELGFVEKRPQEKLFDLELDDEISRLEDFLDLQNANEHTELQPTKNPAVL